ncbi:alcohol dehydrogenase [Sphingomonas sp. Leaf357]|uniref:Zn-dependent alcohol dehydrogenase n=1 Tax=Sphingomonas sp. Leaf357 TaxID=1736350 RepID=UPI0006FF92B9|nr:Zn-dependent alcohol dehydrogenase [Sphingomonas sp. Leaf357]KQS03680.1 alcohol dehydrogenase [Sphingomonas sp. Leaf357]
MKAAILHQPGTPLTIEDVTLGDPGPFEIRLRTVASGLCHSDLSIIDGHMPWRFPALMGHEAAGVVEAVGASVTRIKVGDHVVTSPSAYCGACEDCLGGHMSLCETPGNRRAKGAPPKIALGSATVFPFFELGGFAEAMLIHERNCVAIRKDMPLDRAALLGCAVTTGFGAVARSAKVQLGETVAVIGCGGVGLATINAAAVAGASRIIAIDRVAAKLDAAIQMGATDIVDASTTDAVEAVRELTRGGVHHAIEAIGLKATIEQAFAMLRRGGTATILGIPPQGVKLELAAMDFFGEKKIQGSLMGSNQFPVDIPRYVDLYLQGRMKLDELISRRISLTDINTAFDEMRGATVIARSVIEFPA